MKLTEQANATVKQEEWDMLATILIKAGYGVCGGKEKNPETNKYRKVMLLCDPKEFARGVGA